MRKNAGKKRATRPQASGVSQRQRGHAPKLEPAQRRQVILDAALSVFAERGYEAARLDDVAAKAGVAKGTLYLYFDDKEKLFEEVVRGAVAPVVERLSMLAAAPEMPIGDVLGAVFHMFEKDVLSTRRKLIIRLIISEGPRFPQIAEFYYRDVIGRIMPLVRTLAKQAVQRGELSTDAIARYPQLVAAPLLLAIIWDALFQHIEPLDFADFFQAHGALLTAGTRRSEL